MNNDDNDNIDLSRSALPPLPETIRDDENIQAVEPPLNDNSSASTQEVNSDPYHPDNLQEGLEVHHVIKAQDVPTNHFADAHLAPAMEIPSSDLTISKYEEHPNNSSLNEHGDIDLTRPDSTTSTQYQPASAGDSLGQDLSLDTSVSLDETHEVDSPYSEGGVISQSDPVPASSPESVTEQPVSVGTLGPTPQVSSDAYADVQSQQMAGAEQITGSLAQSDQAIAPTAGLEPASANIKKGPAKIIWIIIAVAIFLILIPVLYFTVVVKQKVGSQTAQGNDVRRASRSRSLITAINLYRNDNADKCPPTLDVLTPEYINTRDSGVVGDKYIYRVDGDKCIVSIAVETEKSLEQYKDEIDNNGNILDYVSNGILNYEN